MRHWHRFAQSGNARAGSGFTRAHGMRAGNSWTGCPGFRRAHTACTGAATVSTGSGMTAQCGHLLRWRSLAGGLSGIWRLSREGQELPQAAMGRQNPGKAAGPCPCRTLVQVVIVNVRNDMVQVPRRPSDALRTLWNCRTSQTSQLQLPGLGMVWSRRGKRVRSPESSPMSICHTRPRGKGAPGRAARLRPLLRHADYGVELHGCHVRPSAEAAEIVRRPGWGRSACQERQNRCRESQEVAGPAGQGGSRRENDGGVASGLQDTFCHKRDQHGA